MPPIYNTFTFTLRSHLYSPLPYVFILINFNLYSIGFLTNLHLHGSSMFSVKSLVEIRLWGFYNCDSVFRFYICVQAIILYFNLVLWFSCNYLAFHIFSLFYIFFCNFSILCFDLLCNYLIFSVCILISYLFASNHLVDAARHRPC